MKVNTLKTAILFLGAMLLPMPTAFMGVDLISAAQALTTAKNFTVSATVQNNCTFSTPPSTLGFGVYDPIVANASTDDEASTTFGFRCTKGGTADLGLSLGGNALSSQRRMVSSGEYLNYELYSDAAYANVWGNGGTEDVAHTQGVVNNQPVTYTIYGKIPAGQDASTGSYTDTVTVTATFLP